MEDDGIATAGNRQLRQCRPRDRTNHRAGSVQRGGPDYDEIEFARSFSVWPCERVTDRYVVCRCLEHGQQRHQLQWQLSMGCFTAAGERPAPDTAAAGIALSS